MWSSTSNPNTNTADAMDRRRLTGSTREVSSRSGGDGQRRRPQVILQRIRWSRFHLEQLETGAEREEGSPMVEMDTSLATEPPSPRHGSRLTWAQFRLGWYCSEGCAPAARTLDWFIEITQLHVPTCACARVTFGVRDGPALTSRPWTPVSRPDSHPLASKACNSRLRGLLQ